MFFQKNNIKFHVEATPVRDISLFDRRTDGTNMSPRGVRRDLAPVPRFTGTKLEQQTAKSATTRPNSDRKIQAMASLRRDNLSSCKKTWILGIVREYIFKSIVFILYFLTYMTLYDYHIPYMTLYDYDIPIL